MPAADTQHGKKAPPRAGPKRKPVLQVGNVVAKTQRRFEQANPRARVKPKAKAPPPLRPRPTRIAHAQEQQYHSQAGAVRRAAATQKTRGLGVGAAVRPAGHRQVLTQARIDAVRHMRQLQKGDQRGTSPVGDRPQGREKAMDLTPVHRAMLVDPNTHREISTLKTPEAPRGSQQRGTSPVGDRPQGRAKEMRAAPTVKPKVGKGPGRVLATVHPANLAGMYASALNWKDPRGASVTGGLDDLTGNAIKDAAELGITMPTTIGHMASEQYKGVKESIKKGSVKPLVKTEVKTGKDLAQPYIEAYKNPKKAITEHPVSTALLFAPAAKVPARLAGRAAAKTGVSSLAKEPATLEGTTLKAQRWQSPDLIDRAVSSHHAVEGKRPKGKTISDDEIKTRVDEAYDAAQLHKQSAMHSAGKQANERFGHLPKDERRVAVEEHMSGAKGGAQQEATRRFAREFGSHWQVHHPKDPKSPPVIVKPKNVDEGGGVLHDSKADAERIAEKVPFEAKVIDVESPSGTQYAVVPKVAADRWGHHGRVGTGPATGSVIMRAGTRQFRRTVLPLSTKWLGGQVGEAAIRALAMGAGPTSYLRARRLLRNMPEKDRRELLNRTVQGGQFGVTGPAKEFARGQESTLAQEFADTGLAKQAEALTKAGAKPVIKQTRQGYRKYSEIVFNDINGTIERMTKTAMLGKAAKQSPLLEKSIIRLSDKAVEEAAAGMRGTSTMVELGRQVDRAYGKYSKWGPHARDVMLHSTPFIPWFINMAKFLTNVMPKDHPVVTSLAASASQADEEWRKAHRLSLHGKDRVPDFLLGSVPKGKKFVQVGRFGPFLPGEYTSSAGGQALPYLQGMLMNAAGVDWTGRELKGAAGSQPGLAANAALTGAETFVPGLSQLDRITGLGDRYVRGKTEKQSVGQGKNVQKAVLDMLNPIKPVGEKSSKKKKKAGGGGFAGFGGGSSGFAGF